MSKVETIQGIPVDLENFTYQPWDVELRIFFGNLITAMKSSDMTRVNGQIQRGVRSYYLNEQALSNFVQNRGIARSRR